MNAMKARGNTASVRHLKYVRVADCRGELIRVLSGENTIWEQFPQPPHWAFGKWYPTQVLQAYTVEWDCRPLAARGRFVLSAICFSSSPYPTALWAQECLVSKTMPDALRVGKKEKKKRKNSFSFCWALEATANMPKGQEVLKLNLCFSVCCNVWYSHWEVALQQSHSWDSFPDNNTCYDNGPYICLILF